MRPAYISRATSLIAIVMNGKPVDPHTISGTCSYDKKQRLVCNLNILAPAGTDYFTIYLGDGKGKLLSAGKTHAYVPANGTVSLHLIFHGLPRTVKLQIDTPNPPVGQPAILHLTAQAFDADDNEIIGDDYLAPVRVAVAVPRPGVSLSGSVLTNPAHSIAIRYNGRLMQPLEIHVVSPNAKGDAGVSLAPDATSRFDLGKLAPRDVATGNDGAVWFTECIPGFRVQYSHCRIGRVSSDGSLRQSADVSLADRIARGPDGAMWFTKGAQPFVGRIDEAGNLSSYRVAPSPRNFASGPIAAGSDGNVWMIDASADASNIDRITPAGNVTRYPVAGLQNTQHLLLGPDGNLWFERGLSLGRVTPNGTLQFFKAPEFFSRAAISSLAIGHDKSLYFIESNRSRARLESISMSGLFSAVPSSAQARMSGPFLTRGPDGELWGPAIPTGGTTWNLLLGRVDLTGAVQTFYSQGSRYLPPDWWAGAWDASGNLWLIGQAHQLTRFHFSP